MLPTMFAVTVLLAAAPATPKPDTAEQQTANSQRATPHSPSNGEIDAAEVNNPHSSDYKDRPAVEDASNDEINAAKLNNPDSSDYKDRPGVEDTMGANASWQALEAGNPHNALPHDGTTLERQATLPSEAPAVGQTNQPPAERCC